MLHLLLAVEHNIVRKGIRFLLESDANINIVGEAINGEEVLQFIKDGVHLDVVLADINLPNIDPLTLIREVHASSPDTQIAILSSDESAGHLGSVFAAGASGYLLKNVSPEELIYSIKHIRSGGKYLCAELVMKMLSFQGQIGGKMWRPAESGLSFTDRELEVLKLTADGLTNHEMSEKLFISKRTVESLRQALVEKTGTRNTASLVRFAVLNGLVD